MGKVALQNLDILKERRILLKKSGSHPNSIAHQYKPTERPKSTRIRSVRLFEADDRWLADSGFNPSDFIREAVELLIANRL
jgi:cupin superfamily acireductone dioxygenase involved in methionine salvage